MIINESELLKEATEKYIDLAKSQLWKEEFIPKAPPILWFGDTLSTKKKIVTIGANPSREEFYQPRRYWQGDLPKYLLPEKERFRVLKNGESYEDIIVNLNLQNDIIFSYNNYFRRKPYSWFGNKYDPQNGTGGRVEAFLNGLDASFYDTNEFEYTAIHLDLFPFATMSDFTDIEKELKIVSKDLFDTQWAQNFLTKLINFINPEAIVVFGRTNFEDYFEEYFRENILIDTKNTYEYVTNNDTKKRTYWLGFYNETIKLAGVSVNLGNPTGMNEYKVLYKFGEHIRQHLKIK